MKRLFTSESVTEGHPDKMCDRISDAILDAILEKDADARVACECMAAEHGVFISGEITSKYEVDVERIARKTICDIGYDNKECGFDGNLCSVVMAINKQSPDIDMGVSRSWESKKLYGDAPIPAENGAGDQGMMFGYACDETPEFMPLPITIAHKLAKRLTQVRKENILPFILPDGKTQVTVEYDENNKPTSIDTIVVSTQHKEDIGYEELREEITKKVIGEVLKEYDWLERGHVNLFINPTGRFVKGGPAADTGLTGRKIIVDTYGGMGRHGGGAFSGKDPSKVDRSGAYMARHIAKSIVSAGLAKKCEVQIAYAIGVANPVSVLIDTFGTGVKSDDEISELVEKVFDMRPSGIINQFKLKRPIYTPTSSYGHFGNEEYPWERVENSVNVISVNVINEVMQKRDL